MTISNNTDNEELLKFDNLSSTWWNVKGSLKTLHVINPLRLKYIDDAIGLANCKVLDIGCGGGLLTEAMSSMGATVTGLDANPSLIEVARQHAKQSELEISYFANTAEEFAQETSERFDLVTCMELLEHVPNPASIFSACRKLLRPNGQLIVTTLNRNLRSYLSAIVAAEYLLDLVPRGTHEYSRFLRPSEISRDLRERGFEVLDISGMHYVPGIDYCYLNNDPAVNYLLHARLKDA
ncbi:MAG: bifunctional 2-polyprenyl-6-hydroxyphenol methylase/3-demethylubiquinol 3-O-methyltransferase UbiG [Gammaproteobacteria bacterium]|nr:bifunctional 2-polyprenyl-6-hydroxyphenol methylase/3-demethylubiquinol 3-O-methyltransferase UbiG [Gammaproteobacteria bacterium]